MFNVLVDPFWFSSEVQGDQDSMFGKHKVDEPFQFQPDDILHIYKYKYD